MCIQITRYTHLLARHKNLDPKKSFKFAPCMNPTDARQLIEAAIPNKTTATWADLGCGAGTFTYAVAELLGDGSKVWAVDKLTQYLGAKRGEVEIEFLQADIERQELPLKALDGIIIANTLHYIKDQADFLQHLRSYLKDTGKLILVEYDTERSNQWVPFPVTYEMAQALLSNAGFKDVSQIGEHPSSFRNEMIFACVAHA
ncbi:MAG TPA: class I SAM-dependent methyltransferase [Cyclobacteriaceae bacterium]|nr:class I SAM-dependent methyltransferase [Cyclobacteriaceae bacterium]